MRALDLDLQSSGDGVRLRVRVKPRASKSRIVGVRSRMLEVAVAAPPVDGEANAELVRVLSRAMGVKKSAIHIVSGDASREKLVEIAVDRAEFERILAEAVGG
jgi:uncharacterized protein